VPEGRQIFPNLTVRENLVAFAGNRSARTDPWTPARVLEFFPRLAERAGNMGNQLSGGEQQMLAIGRALVDQPHLLIVWRSASLIRRSSRGLIDASSVCPAVPQPREALPNRSRTSGAAGLRRLVQDQQVRVGHQRAAMASICCSPPESWLPMLPARSASRGKNSSTLAGVQGSRPGPSVAGKRDQVLAHREVGKNLPPFGHQRDAGARDAIGFFALDALARKLIVPPLARVRPMIERTVVVLPMPLRPSRVTASPVLISKFSLKST